MTFFANFELNFSMHHARSVLKYKINILVHSFLLTNQAIFVPSSYKLHNPTDPLSFQKKYVGVYYDIVKNLAKL